MLLRGEGNLTPNIPYALKLIEQAALEGENTAPLFLRDAYESGYYELEINLEKSNYYQKLYNENKEMPELGTPVDIEKDLELKLKKPILKFID